MPDRKKLITVLTYTGYFIAAFLVFVVVLFPYDRVKNRIESEVRVRTPFELNIGRIAPRFLNRVTLLDVVVSDRTGTVLFESPALRAHLSLFGLLRGLLGVDLRGQAYGGEVMLQLEEGAKRHHLSVDIDGLDAGAYPLFKSLGYTVSGRLGGSFTMTDGTGRAKVWAKDLASRELKVKGFPVPDLDFEQGWFEAEVKNDRLSIKRLDLDGKELKVRISGELVTRERGLLNLVIRLKPSERIAKEQAVLLSFLKNRDPEGFYQFTLGGTLNEPLPRF